MDQNYTKSEVINSDYASQWLEEYAKDLCLKNLQEKAGKITKLDEKPVYVIYARRSSKGEKQAGSPESQVKECMYYAKQHDLEVSDIVKEDNTAFKSGDRVLFKHLIDEIKKGGGRRFNSILAWSPDRLSRNMKEGGEIIDLLDNKVIVDLQFPKYYFINDANGKMTLGFQFVLAKQYSENLSLHTIRGNITHLEQAKVLKTPPYGYIVKAKKDRRLLPDEVPFKLLKQSCELIISGGSLKKASEYLNHEGFTYRGVIKHFTAKELSKLLIKPILAGLYVLNDQVFDFREIDPEFKPILTAIEFWKLRERLGSKSRVFKSQNGKMELLRDIVRCEYCDSIMGPSASRGKAHDHYLYLKCSNDKCPRNLEEATGYNKKYKKAIRGAVIFNFMYTMVDSCMKIPVSAYSKYVKTAQSGLEEAKVKLLHDIKSAETRQGSLISKIGINMDDLSKAKIRELDTGHIDALAHERETLIGERGVVDAEVKSLKEDLAKIQLGISGAVMSKMEFSNTMQNIGNIIRYSKNQGLVQAVVKMMFSNIWVDTEKVTKFRLNSPFDEYVKIDEIQSWVADGI